MRIPTSRDNRSLRDDSSMTSMIDVVFLLLIFFVCASLGQMGELLVTTELPAGAIDSVEFEKQEKPLGEVWLFLTVDGEGKTRVQVNRNGVTYEQGAAEDFRHAEKYPQFVKQLQAMAENDGSVPVIIDMQDAVPSGDLIAVYTAANQVAGFQAVNFAIDPAAGSPQSP